jgi:hypothetical protein
VAEIEYTMNLEPRAQYQRGDSLVFRASTATELEALLLEAETKKYLSEFFYGGPAVSLGTTNSSAETTVVKVHDVTDEDKPLSDIEAIANIEKHLGKPASPAQIAVAAKKSGKTVEELTGISEERAKELIKKGAA